MLSRLYGAVANARNSLYERGIFKRFSLGVPVISIGNITVGGTGKTPLVALVAEILAENGERVCVLTRGYGRENPKKRVLVSDGERILVSPEQSGDEPFELARKLLGGKAVVVADANRAAAGVWAREKFGITWFVLDDAFQHRRVRRDADVVLVDATEPFGNKKTLPSGILREPLENLKRADAIVVTRVNLATDIANLKLQIAEYNSKCPIFAAANRISRLVRLEEFHAEEAQSSEVKRKTDDETKKTKALAFCALGNPNNFFEQLRRENYELTSTRTFPDHHFYTQNDTTKLAEKAKNAGARVLLTTAKDAVKLKNLKFEAACFVVESEIIFDGESDFREWVTEMRNEK